MISGSIHPVPNGLFNVALEFGSKRRHLSGDNPNHERIERNLQLFMEPPKRGRLPDNGGRVTREELAGLDWGGRAGIPRFLLELQLVGSPLDPARVNLTQTAFAFQESSRLVCVHAHHLSLRNGDYQEKVEDRSGSLGGILEALALNAHSLAVVTRLCS